MPPHLELLSPVDGIVRALAEVPDVAFADELIGPGIAVAPDVVFRSSMRAPATGRLGAVYPHAIALEVGGGRSVLVHLGINTVGLQGEGFEVHVRAGDQVVAGQVIVTWSPRAVQEAGLSTICPVIAVQADPALVTVLAPVGTRVRAGEPLLGWD